MRLFMDDMRGENSWSGLVHQNERANLEDLLMFAGREQTDMMNRDHATATNKPLSYTVAWLHFPIMFISSWETSEKHWCDVGNKLKEQKSWTFPGLFFWHPCVKNGIGVCWAVNQHLAIVTMYCKVINNWWDLPAFVLYVWSTVVCTANTQQQWC